MIRPRLHRAQLAAVACLLSFAVHATGARAAATDPLQIRWVAPLDCPRGGFDLELLRLLDGKPPAATAEVDVSTLSEGSQRYRLSLQLSAAEQQATRELTLASCGEVRHAAALLIATALHDVEAAVPSRTGARGWQLRLGVLGDALSLPAITAGPEIGLGWQRGRLRLALEARYLLAREARDDDSALRVDLGLLAGSLGAGYLFALGPFDIGPALAVELGWLRAQAAGERATDEATLWASALVGGRAELPMNDRLGLALTAQLSVPLRRPRFSLADEPSFYETRPVGVRAGIAIYVRFGVKRSASGGQ